jgi:hypothetical protein
METLNEIINESENNDKTIIGNDDNRIFDEPDSQMSNENSLSENGQNESVINQPVPENDVVKSKRGRHKKDCQCDKCKSKTSDKIDSDSNVENENLGNDVDSKIGNQNSKISDTNPLDLSEFKKVEISSQSSNPNEVNASKYLTGAIVLMMIDAVIPSVLIKMMSMANPKYKQIKTKEIKLSKEQKNDLEPLADEVVKQMTVTMSPMTAFLVCTSLIYGTNIMTATDE